jgi:hypothetical protein
LVLIEPIISLYHNPLFHSNLFGALFRLCYDE